MPLLKTLLTIKVEICLIEHQIVDSFKLLDIQEYELSLTDKVLNKDYELVIDIYLLYVLLLEIDFNIHIQSLILKNTINDYYN